jgi:hypothetical protein
VRRRLALLALAAVVLVAAAWYVIPYASGRHGPAWPGLAPAPLGAQAPDSVRIKVEVLNATRTTGLARRATLFLRDRGFDVVEVSNAEETHDTTMVIDRSNHPAWAALVASAMGGAVVESRPDSSRYLDVTVLVGASWHPPTQPFYP